MAHLEVLADNARENLSTGYTCNLLHLRSGPGLHEHTQDGPLLLLLQFLQSHSRIAIVPHPKLSQKQRAKTRDKVCSLPLLIRQGAGCAAASLSGLIHFTPKDPLDRPCQQVPGTSASHILMFLTCWRVGLFHRISVSGLQESYGVIAGALGDMDYIAACFAKLLVEGHVSIGLLGVCLPFSKYSDGGGAAAGSAADAFDLSASTSKGGSSSSGGPHSSNSSSSSSKGDVHGSSSTTKRSSHPNNNPRLGSIDTVGAFATADSLLKTWKAAVNSSHHQLQQFGRVKGAGSAVVWADVHDISSILHHFDGFVTDDDHLIFTSCQNLVTNTWWPTSADLSLPFYQQQEMRWIPHVLQGRSSTIRGSSNTAVTTTSTSISRAADEGDPGLIGLGSGVELQQSTVGAAAEAKAELAAASSTKGSPAHSPVATAGAAAAGGTSYDAPPIFAAPAAAASAAVGVAAMAAQALVGLSTVAAFTAAAGDAILTAAVLGTATAVAVAAIPISAVAAVAAASAISVPAAKALLAAQSATLSESAAAAPTAQQPKAATIVPEADRTISVSVAAVPSLPAAPPAAVPLTPPACSKIILHLNSSHYTVSIINHQERMLLYFDSLGGAAVPKALSVPKGYMTTVLSFRAQSQATCGPHALFVALAYVSDFHRFRSSCRISSSGSSSSHSQKDSSNASSARSNGNAKDPVWVQHEAGRGTAPDDFDRVGNTLSQRQLRYGTRGRGGRPSSSSGSSTRVSSSRRNLVERKGSVAKHNAGAQLNPWQCLEACFFGAESRAGSHDGNTGWYGAKAGWSDQVVSSAFRAVASQ